MSNYTALPASGHVARWSGWDGHHTELTEIRWENEGWTINGQVSRERVQYVLRVTAMWQVRQFLLFRDLADPDLWLYTDGTTRWGEMNGAEREELAGCSDIDLHCTPFTNTVPIRRLPIGVGDRADVPVVSVDVETLGLRPVTKHYFRLDTHRWAFTEGDESVEFDVDDYGLVIDQPGRFRRVA